MTDIEGYKLIRSDHPDNIKRGGVCVIASYNPVRVINLESIAFRNVL